MVNPSNWKPPQRHITNPAGQSPRYFLDAVGTVVELMVSLDLLADPAKSLDKLVIATVGQAWFGNQLVANTVIVRQGLNGEVFVKFPDGRYNPPPGKAIELTTDPDGRYRYQTLDRAAMDFDADGRIAPGSTCAARSKV